MSYDNITPYTLSTAQQIVTPDISLSLLSSTDREIQERQGRSGTAPTTLLSYANGDTIDLTTSPDPLPRGNSSANQQEKLNVVIDTDTKLNEYLMIYENDSKANIDARRFRNVMRDSYLIIRRSNVSV